MDSNRCGSCDQHELIAAQAEYIRNIEGGYRQASKYLDRWRDIIADCLGHEEKPGDDVMREELRAHFGKTGPEPTRWRDFVSGAVMHVELHTGKNMTPWMDEPVDDQP